MALSKSRRAFETEVENFSRNQREVSDKLRRILPPSDPSNYASNEANDGGDDVNERSGLLKQKSTLSGHLNQLYIKKAKIKFTFQGDYPNWI